jgi:hypothetical protein
MFCAKLQLPFYTSSVKFTHTCDHSKYLEKAYIPNNLFLLYFFEEEIFQG